MILTTFFSPLYKIKLFILCNILSQKKAWILNWLDKDSWQFWKSFSVGFEPWNEVMEIKSKKKDDLCYQTQWPNFNTIFVSSIDKGIHSLSRIFQKDQKRYFKLCNFLIDKFFSAPSMAAFWLSITVKTPTFNDKQWWFTKVLFPLPHSNIFDSF